MLPAEQRLRDNREFRQVYARGRSYVHPCAVLHLWRRPPETLPGCRRIGFVVSKKQGDAVRRNRIKRRLREAVRHLLPQLREGAYDLVVVGRSRALNAEWPELKAAISELLRRSGSLLPSAAERVQP